MIYHPFFYELNLGILIPIMKLSEIKAQKILTLWFGEETTDWPRPVVSKRWFMGGKPFDDLIRTHFSGIIQQLLSEPVDFEQQTAIQNLASIIVLDQFTRNIFRGSDGAFSGDNKALNIAKYMVSSKQYLNLKLYQRIFVYMPFEHSENNVDQRRCIRLFNELIQAAEGPFADKVNGFARYALEHADIIEQFGRFPHRNKILQRESTVEEIHYLQQGKTFGQ